MRLLFLFTFVALSSAKLRFDGDEVLTLYPQNHLHVQLLKDLEEEHDVVDFWTPASAAGVRQGSKVDVHFKHSALRIVKNRLTAAKLKYEVKINNLQELMEKQIERRSSSNYNGYDYYVYHTNDEIQQWISDIAQEFPDFIQKSVLTNSTEGREVNMLRMGSSTNKKKFLIDCGVHAREWISPAFCQYFVHKMLTEYYTNLQVKRMMDEITWIIVPVLNVDGYEYSWTTDRLWRKTRSVYDGNVCVGVDANRNFDINWSGEGASNNSCSNTYCGPSVESEPIIKALADLIRSNAEELRGYIAIHSYSQIFVFPYSYDYVNATNNEQLYDVSSRAAQAIYEETGKIYTYGPGHMSLYLVSGGSKDWALELGIPLSWTVELRDTGEHGFLLPEDQIEPTCREAFKAMEVIAEETITNTNPIV